MDRDGHFRLAQGLNQSSDPRVLGTIAMDGIAAAVWNRQLLDDFREWLQALPVHQLPTLDTLVAVQHAEDTVLAACDSAGIPMSDKSQQLCRDIGELAQMFSQIVEEPLLRLRLDRFENRADQKFHMGNVRARLFCSYRGVEIDFGAAEVNGIPKQTHRIPLGMPAIFRGLMWDAIELSRIVHRPAPMSHPGEVSLLLTIDTVNSTRQLAS